MAKQKRVLKTILLLQAINEKVGDSVSLFIPNAKNLGMAFEGTDISLNNAASLAQSLVKEQIIFERPMGGGAMKYSALISNGNQEEIDKEKERLRREIRTDKLIEEGEFINDFKLPKNLEIRFPLIRHLTYENIKMSVAQLKSDSMNHPTRLYALRDDATYRTIVDRLLEVPDKADTRDTEEIKRIATAYLKLLFPNVRKVTDITVKDFKTYCLSPAVKMRSIVRMQQALIDKEYKGKDVPEFKIIAYEN